MKRIMKITEIEDYLIGKSFSSGLRVDISSKSNHVQLRIPYLESLVHNKNVIHLGCCDHIELLDLKIKENSWLHGILINSSQRCVGIDINEVGINELINRGIGNVHCLDIQADDLPESIYQYHWDYLILGEILEHVDNPVAFLQSIKSKFDGVVDQFVITVPNAYTFYNIVSLLNKVELINSDHRYWFTPYTLGKICYQAGFKVQSIDFLRKDRISSVLPIKKIFFRKFPHFLDTIAIVLTISTDK